jgi:hypothetical protein
MKEELLWNQKGSSKNIFLLGTANEPTQGNSSSLSRCSRKWQKADFLMFQQMSRLKQNEPTHGVDSNSDESPAQ